MNDRNKTMTDGQREWQLSKRSLMEELRVLGFRRELGEAIAANLGSPKAMRRMTSYLRQVKPRSEELVVDEMLAICSEIESWREKKANEQANARYNEILNYGFDE